MGPEWNKVRYYCGQLFYYSWMIDAEDLEANDGVNE
jgi:hypothetical protein